MPKGKHRNLDSLDAILIQTNLAQQDAYAELDQDRDRTGEMDAAYAAYLKAQSTPPYPFNRPSELMIATQRAERKVERQLRKATARIEKPKRAEYYKTQIHEAARARLGHLENLATYREWAQPNYQVDFSNISSNYCQLTYVRSSLADIYDRMANTRYDAPNGAYAYYSFDQRYEFAHTPIDPAYPYPAKRSSHVKHPSEGKPVKPKIEKTQPSKHTPRTHRIKALMTLAGDFYLNPAPTPRPAQAAKYFTLAGLTYAADKITYAAKKIVYLKRHIDELRQARKAARHKRMLVKVPKVLRKLAYERVKENRARAASWFTRDTTRAIYEDHVNPPKTPSPRPFEPPTAALRTSYLKHPNDGKPTAKLNSSKNLPKKHLEQFSTFAALERFAKPQPRVHRQAALLAHGENFVVAKGNASKSFEELDAIDDLRHDSAAQIQNVYRAYAARKVVKTAAANLIQTAFRAHQVTKAFKADKAAEAQAKSTATRTIQHFFKDVVMPKRWEQIREAELKAVSETPRGCVIF